MHNDDSFGQLVKSRRRELGLTQDELARRVGCAAITLRKIEADDLRPSVQIAERLAMALTIPLEERAAFVRLAREERVQFIEPAPTPAPSTEEIGAEDLSGRAIRGYALAELIGSGGMGVVYRAVQPLVEREVAVKIILPSYANQPDFIRRFEAEAQLVARLEHPHIVPLYDYWREPNVAYLVMRLLRGGSVQRLLQGGALLPDQVLRIVEQIGSALGAAHRAGVVHRDLKPANVLLDEDSNAYLADFGIAKNLSNPNLEDVTRADAIVGSPDYISPEQIRSEFVRPQTDIYCLGVMLYELLTGSVPFQGPTPIEVMHQHLTAPLPPLAANRVGLPRMIDDVIAQATAKDSLERYVDVESMLADLRQAMQGSGNGKRRATTLVQAPSPDRRPLTAADNPYKGLRAFGEGDTQDFFGRESLIQQLLLRLGEGGDLSRFLAVVGPSGSGKSSVVRAGLIPALRRGGLPGSDNWFIVEMVPGAYPVEELEAALLRVAVNPPESLIRQLREDKRGLLRATLRCLPYDPGIELVLVIDQFEEVFTLLQDEATRAHFLDLLVTAALDERSRVRIILTLRADFIDRPLGYMDFGELLRQRMEVVLPLTPDELEQAIVKPAGRVGLEIESGLVPIVLHDVGDQPSTLPLLQYAFTELFEKRADLLLTKFAYQSIGGVLGALGRKAEEVFMSLDKSGRAATRQLFLRLVTLGEGVEDTRRRALKSEIESLFGQIHSQRSVINNVIEIFVRSRLLALDRDPGTRSPTVEVAHEALLREWPRLREWLNESRSDVRLQRQLGVAAAEWHSASRDPSFLLTGARLEQFEGWSFNTTLALTGDERGYLDASASERGRTQAEEATRQQRELEAARKLAETERQSAVRLRLRNRVITAVGALAIVAAIIAALLGGSANSAAQNNATLAAQNAAIANTAQAANTQVVEQRNVAVDAQATAVGEAQVRATQQAIAEANFTRAEAQRLAAEAINLLNTKGNSETVALLTLRSLNLEYSPQGDAVLLRAVNLNYPLRIFTGHTGTVLQVAFSPDDQTILTGSNDNTARLFDIETGQPLQVFSGHTDQINDLAFAADGNWVLTGSSDKTARLWDTASGKEIRIFVGHTNIVNTVAFSSDGEQILTGSEDSTMRLWNIETGRELNQWFIEEPVSAISPDGTYAVGYSETDNANHLWDINALTKTHSFTYPGTIGRGNIEFSSDGKYLLAGYGLEIVLSDLTSGQELQVFKGHTDGVNKLAFSPDGKYILSGSFDRTVRLWDIQTGHEVRQFSGHAGAVYSVAFSRDGERILTGGADNTVRLWNVEPRPELPTFNGGNDMYGIAFSPDGRQMATNVISNELRLWDIATGQMLWSTQGNGLALWALKFSPDGKYLLSGNMDGVTTLWDAETGKEVRQFTAQGLDEIYGLAFSPDGKTIVAGGFSFASNETFIPMWEVETGKEILRFPLLDIVYGMSFSPDGKYLFTGGGGYGVSYLWDAQTGTKLREFVGGAAVFSPDGNYVVTVKGSTGFVLDVQTGQEIRRFDGPADGIGFVVYSSDGKFVAAVNFDGSVRLWDPQTGQELRRYLPPAPANNLTFSPDSQYLVSLSTDGIARFFDVDYRTTMAYLCSRLLRDFSDNERAQYGVPNDGPTCP